jgi:MarR family 2-MHQ and catechol resistance regulon transcriptional repressor
MAEKKNADLNQPGSDDIKKVAEQIGELNFWLCVTFSDTIMRYLEITMKKDDISPLHLIALHCLVRTGGSLTPTHLSELMFRSKHSVTKIVDNLEKQGFIVRDFSSQDRRVTHIRVTASGLEYLKNNQKKGEKRAHQVMSCLNAAEEKRLVELADKLNNRMTDILEKIS